MSSLREEFESVELGAAPSIEEDSEVSSYEEDDELGSDEDGSVSSNQPRDAIDEQESNVAWDDTLSTYGNATTRGKSTRYKHSHSCVFDVLRFTNPMNITTSITARVRKLQLRVQLRHESHGHAVELRGRHHEW